MKRTYVNRLPESEKVKNTNVRIENGALIVEVEFEEKFQPKDGDFLVSKSGKVFIYSIKTSHNSFVYSAYCGIRKNGEISIDFSTIWTIKEGCRYATEQEKSAFLARLEKECGKKWNEETKELEDIRWRAEDGDEYFYVGFDYIVRNRIDERQVSANENYRNHNYFRTFESAQKVADQIKEIFKNSKAE